MSNNKKIKVLLAKISLDGHNRGIKVISKWLSDAGMEVIFLGQFLTEEMVVRASVEEDVDVVGLSFLGGEHLLAARDMREEMKKQGLSDDVLFIMGGVIPKEDVIKLEKVGVDMVFLPGTPMDDIVNFITDNVQNQ